MSEWPGADRRRVDLGSPSYAVRAPLARWLRDEAQRAARDLGRYRVLDVGSGIKPYYPFFEPYASEYVGVDSDNPSADLQGTIESLPVDDGSYDLVLCTQVLEHCDDPARAVRELRRVVAQGGRVLASTHGVQVYHPSPVDYWRWTHAGLERLFTTNADWASVSVRPSSGTVASLAMLIGIYLDLALRRRLRLGRVSAALMALLNRTAAAIDARSALLREPGPGTLHANYHVVAEAPRRAGSWEE